MRALIFAAGLGERMRPLTAHTPKPLLEAGGRPLIAWHLDRLADFGVHEAVINTSWLADRFPAALGDGSRWGMRLHYSFEGATPLETGGGMRHALPLLRDPDAPDAPFLAINGDIWTDYDLSSLPAAPRGLAHLVLVENPPHHPRGDFALHADGTLGDGDAVPRLTFAGIGLYQPAILDDWREVIGDTPGARRVPPRFPLAPLLHAAAARGQATGEHHRGRWTDVGTPQRLAALDAQLREAAGTDAR